MAEKKVLQFRVAGLNVIAVELEEHVPLKEDAVAVELVRVTGFRDRWVVITGEEFREARVEHVHSI